jgi:prepilin-type N-terminal cleavage/methylation domain-containing protein
MKRLRDNHGFTLLELMIVVAIVGLLSTIAIPNFFGMQKRAKTTEAKSNLGALWSLQEAYFIESETYANPSTQIAAGQHDGSTGWAELGFYPKGTTRYMYEVVSASNTAFLARASGDIDGDGSDDVWTIDEVGELSHTTTD